MKLASSIFSGGGSATSSTLMPIRENVLNQGGKKSNIDDMHECVVTIRYDLYMPGVQ
jgi:hypothetical protein